MSFDEKLAARIRKSLGSRRGIEEKRMFGGVAFLLRGHMFAGIVDSTLMARVGPENYEGALKAPGVRVMDFTGTPLRGYVYVDLPAIRTDAALARWLSLCADFVAALPPKVKKPEKSKKQKAKP